MSNYPGPGYWRRAATPIIRSVIESAGTSDVRELRAALRKAYPFGERKRWPYKVWCDEINVQLGLKQVKTIVRPAKDLTPSPGQKELF